MGKILIAFAFLLIPTASFASDFCWSASCVDLSANVIGGALRAAGGPNSDNPMLVGFRFEVKNSRWPAFLVIGLSEAIYQDKLCSDINNNCKLISELSIGGLKYYGSGQVHPYLGAGLSLICSDAIGSTYNRALYINGGILYRFMDGFNLGLDARSAFGSMTHEDFTTLGILLGYSW